jgi:hypothetical protein
MDTFQKYYDNTIDKYLNKDPESDVNYPNKVSRSVKSGHYLVSKPTPYALSIYGDGRAHFSG